MSFLKQIAKMFKKNLVNLFQCGSLRKEAASHLLSSQQRTFHSPVNMRSKEADGGGPPVPPTPPVVKDNIVTLPNLLCLSRYNSSEKNGNTFSVLSCVLNQINFCSDTATF